MYVKDLVDFIDGRFPFSLASSFDVGKLGLQVGSMNDKITGVLITLDATSDVIDEAIAKGANLIITHHPFIFDPLLRISYDEPAGQKLIRLISNRINVISMHTNYDAALGGMNDLLASMLGLKQIQSLYPENAADNFLRFGKIPPLSLKTLALTVKHIFHLDGIRLIGEEDRLIQTVGIVGGGGATEIGHALNAGCDVLITGEVRQNNALLAREKGLAVIEVTHFIESSFKKPLQQLLRETFQDLPVTTSQNDVDPFRYL